tara:strand:- start:220 stop:456 length:237 start_codon:yes stop_codon:yes gene_type:complete
MSYEITIKNKETGKETVISEHELISAIQDNFTYEVELDDVELSVYGGRAEIDSFEAHLVDEYADIENATETALEDLTS